MPRPEPALRFAPLTWLKLRLFLHAGQTEVGFFGISDEEDLLYVQELAVPKQSVSAASVCFDDLSVADYFDDCADRGITPQRCGRIWIHTHPGDSPQPSFVDEQTFARVFGNCDWAIMAIVARQGASYARLSFTAGPGGSAIIPIEVDWERLPEALLDGEGSLDSLFSGWMDEYGRKIHPQDLFSPLNPDPLGLKTVRFQTHQPEVRSRYLDELVEQEIYQEKLLNDRFQFDLDYLPEEEYR